MGTATQDSVRQRYLDDVHLHSLTKLRFRESHWIRASSWVSMSNHVKSIQVMLLPYTFLQADMSIDLLQH